MKKITILLTFCFSIISLGATAQKRVHFDVQSHRGGRGLMPENTILSQQNAIDFRTTMEMDLQMTKDKKIIVSHEAFMDAVYVLTPEGTEMSKKDGRSRLIYDMDYDSVAQYDVGLKHRADFPNRKLVPAHKPLLSELIDSVETYAHRAKHINHYNIEIKTNPKFDGTQYSSVEEFVDLAMHIIIEKGIGPRTMIQSFDVRALRLVRENWPAVAVSYLVWGNEKESAEEFIEELGFVPDIFSPNYQSCTKENVAKFHEMGIRVIPWTPNTVEEMQKLKDMGVDGIITDYPNLFVELK